MSDQELGIDAFTLAAKVFPEKEYLLKPWIARESMTMLWAPTGVGKSWVALGVAQACAAGGTFLKWQAPKACKVVYIDGEMGERTLHERIRKIDYSAERGMEKSNIMFYTPRDKINNGVMWNLADPAEQGRYSKIVEPYDLIIIDNLATLARTYPRKGTCNEVDIWASVQLWAITQRAKGKSILFIHHSNKSQGDFRGSSTQIDTMNVVIGLSGGNEALESKEGAEFNLHFKKARELFGEDTQSLRVSLTQDADDKEKLTWKYGPFKTHQEQLVHKALANGFSKMAIITAYSLSTMQYEKYKDNFDKEKNYENENEANDRGNNRGRKDHGDDPF